MFAVNILVEDTNRTIATLRYPRENGGKASILKKQQRCLILWKSLPDMDLINRIVPLTH